MAPLLLIAAATHRRRKEALVQKKMFKVICPIEKKGGGKFWMRLGSAFANKDDSINVYLDAVPKNLEFQLRELTEEELSRKSSYGDSAGAKPLPSAGGNLNQIPF